MREYKSGQPAQLRRTHGETTGPVGVRRQNTEMNTTERFYLPVDGILEMFNSSTGHQKGAVTYPLLPLVPRHPTVTDISKAGMGIIKAVRGRWRQQGRRAAESRSSSSGNLHHKRCLDLLELGLIKPKNCRRVVVLGAPKAGKTNILQRFLGEDFDEGYQPTGEDFHRKLFHVGGELYQVDLLDAASERDFPAKRRLSILTGDIFLLVFSVDDRSSFDEVRQLLAEVQAAKTKLLKLKHPARVPAVICGNKADLDARTRVVSRSEVTELLGEDAAFFETSAKVGTGLEDAFRHLAALGGLPDETSPSRHQIVSILNYRSMCIGQRGRRWSRTRGLGAPCAAVDPLARRPSFTSDLRLVLKSNPNKPERCQIQ